MLGFLVILSSCNKKIPVDVPKSADSIKTTSGNKVYRMEEFLGEGIKNAVGHVDQDKGIITISFDYPEQNWLNDFSDICGKFYPYPMYFSVILYDKNDKKLTEVDTKKLYVPESVYKSCQKYWDVIYTNSYPSKPKIIPLKQRGNEIFITVDQVNAEYVKKAFMYFSVGNKIIGKENMYKLGQDTVKK